MKRIFIAFVASLILAATANAATITKQWIVTDGQTIGNDHGLWTNGLPSTTTENQKRHSFDAGTRLVEYDNGTAHLTGTATNYQNQVATIDIWFNDRRETYSKNKTGGGPVVDDWYYYTQILEGSKITINTVDYYVGMVMFGTGPVLQIGTGANDKNSAYGASTWLDVFSDISRSPNSKLFGDRHWDLNMNLTAVPVPAAAWLFGSALIGFVALRRKSS